MEEARHQAAMAELEQADTQVTAINAQSEQASLETLTFKAALAKRKEEIAHHSEFHFLCQSALALYTKFVF